MAHFRYIFNTFDRALTHGISAATRVDPSPMFYKIWRGLVSIYSDACLTKPLDKLVALSGIARSFSSATQDTSVVVMWQANLEKDL